MTTGLQESELNKKLVASPLHFFYQAGGVKTKYCTCS